MIYFELRATTLLIYLLGSTISLFVFVILLEGNNNIFA